MYKFSGLYSTNRHPPHNAITESVTSKWLPSIAVALHMSWHNKPFLLGRFPSQRPVTQSFGVFFNLCLNKRLSKQSWGLWYETPSHSLWRHYNVGGVFRDVIFWPRFHTLSSQWYMQDRVVLHHVLTNPCCIRYGINSIPSEEDKTIIHSVFSYMQFLWSYSLWCKPLYTVIMVMEKFIFLDFNGAFTAPAGRIREDGIPMRLSV